MYEPFKRRKGTYQAVLAVTLAGVLEQFFTDIAALLTDELPDMSDPLVAMTGISPNAEPSSDPRVRRLLPEGVRDTHELGAEYRRFTDIPLRQSKAANLTVAAESLREAEPATARRYSADGGGYCTLTLSQPQALAWLTALADGRLVLAAELGISDALSAATFEAWMRSVDPDAVDASEQDRFQQGIVYEVLEGLQSSLVQALSVDL